MNEWQIALQLDKLDHLARFRNYFVNNPDEIYLDGNSLGKLPKTAVSTIENAVKHEWGNRLIRGWNESWLNTSERISSKLAKLIGAKSDEVFVGDSTSANLYKLASALMESKLVNKHILTDSLNFPSDRYVLDGLARQHKTEPVHVVEYYDEISADISLLKDAISRNNGIICLSLVSYKSSYLYDMTDLNQFAEENNSIIIWDLSHATGVVDFDLNESNTKLAVGCSYKFMNGGPGAPSFLYVHSSLHDELNNPIQGWFGHYKPFEFHGEYSPSPNANRFAVGTPQMLSMVAMEPGIDLTLEAGTNAIRAKSIEQGEFFVELVKKYLTEYGFNIESPTDSERRGSHVTISHQEAWRICQALISGKGDRPTVIPDFRPNRYIRFGFAPLYNTFTDLVNSVDRIKQIIAKKEYLQYSKETVNVT